MTPVVTELNNPLAEVSSASEPVSYAPCSGAGRHVLMMFQPSVGGVPHYVADLVEELVDRDWQISVAAPSDSPVLPRIAAVAQEVLALETSSVPKRGDGRICRDLVAYCQHAGIDLIHAHSSKAGALAAFIGRRAGIKSVYTPHGWSFERELSPLARLGFVFAERLLATRHEMVIGVADAERTAAIRARVGKPSRLMTVHTGLRSVSSVSLAERDAARTRLGITGGDGFVVGWVGRLGLQKRSEQLPELARRLQPLGTFAVLGYGLSESQAGRDLADLGSTITSFASATDIYLASDALAVTSRWEGFPLVVLEAMRAGLPVVAYDVGGISEQIEDGVTGFLIPSGDVEAMGARLRELAQNPALTQAMGIAARNRFDEHFRIERMVDKLETIYRQSIRQRDKTLLSDAPLARRLGPS